MKLFENLFGKKGYKESTVPISELVKNTVPENAVIISQSEVPEWTLMGNLIFEQKYDEAIDLGKKLLIKNPHSAGVHIELMVAYFKLRKLYPEYFELSTYHAKQAIIYGHNTGYAHERLIINLEKSGMINQAIQLCDIVLSEKYHFISTGCGKKENFLFRKEKLKYKRKSAKDNISTKLFTNEEIYLLYENLRDDNNSHIEFTISDEEIEKELKRIRDKANKVAKNYIFPNSSQPYITNGVPLGTQYEQIIKLLPEFDFYDNPNEHWNFVRSQSQDSIWKIRDMFYEKINTASSFERDGNFAESAKIYEIIISEKYWLSNPYDRLIKIYSKAKLKDDEKRVIELAISHFTELRERQKKYILDLAQKYGKLDFVIERIKNNQKIFYYGGAIELYNPYQIIDKWKERLIKIKIVKQWKSKN
jgi:hypothetical protein